MAEGEDEELVAAVVAEVCAEIRAAAEADDLPLPPPRRAPARAAE
jgi:hypothetical protein